MQSYYDQIEGFEYWSIEGWKRFVKENILPLYISTSKILKLREHLLKTLEGKKLSEVQREMWPLLLGGVNEEGKYKENSFAYFIKQTLGIYVETERWAMLEKDPEMNASEYIEVKTANTYPFLNILTQLNQITLYLLQRASLPLPQVSEDEIKEILKNPERILELVSALYEQCLNVSANHNYYTFFALSTKTLTFRYMVAAYPKLAEKLESLKDFLGLEKKFEPKVNEPLKENYTLWGHIKNGLLDLIVILNYTIWDIFKDNSAKIVFGYVSNSLVDLREEYSEMVEQKLDEIKWQYPEHIRMSRLTNPPYTDRGIYQFYYEVSGPMITEESEYSISWSGNPTRGKRQVNVSLLQFLDELSPALFFGLGYLEGTRPSCVRTAKRRCFALKLSEHSLFVYEG